MVAKVAVRLAKGVVPVGAGGPRFGVGADVCIGALPVEAMVVAIWIRPKG